MIVAVADIGGTVIKLGLFQNGQILVRRALPAESHAGLARQLPQIAGSWRAMLDESETATDEIAAIGVSFPSIIDPVSSRVVDAYGKYADAPLLDLQEWARAEFDAPLFIDNDARLALLGEWRAGAGRDCDDLVMVALGTGLGSAAVVQGHLLRGRHGQAGILGGHWSIDPNGNTCACGNIGCAEAHASTLALPGLAMAHPGFGTSALKRADIIDYMTVFNLARQGDACAMALRAQSIAIWATMIVSLIHAYDPQRVIVGGGITSGSADFMDDLVALVLARAHTPWGEVQIVRAELGDDAALIGAGILARDQNLRII
jgi:glucokinase